MTPCGTKPFDRSPECWFECDALQIVEDIIQTHRTQPVKKTTGIVQHNARFLAFLNELGNEFSHAFVTPVEDRGVVVIPDLRVIHHVFQVAYDRSSVQIRATGWNQWLVHMQR